MRSPHRVVALAALLLFGCQLVLGIKEGHPRSDGAGAGNGEDCGNGVDDDGDGAVDCQDEQCADHMCVNVPDGWSGPIQVAPGDTAVPCQSSESTTLGGTGTVAIPEARCYSCQCDPQASECSASVAVHMSTNCLDAATAQGSGSGCFNLIMPGAPILTSATATTTGPSTGCDRSGGGVVEPRDPPEFDDDTYQYCGLPVGEGCVTGKCLPSIGGYWIGPCIYQVGDVDCNAGAFRDKLVLERIQSDTRGCSDCECTPQGSCVDDQVMFFAGEDCTG